jgi:dephospho-CoA kinase
MRRGSKVVIGVAGNIGAGKTTVSKIFEELGAQYISADEIGWAILPKTADVLQKRFGEEIMQDHDINKEKLREMVFSDIENLEFLNRVSHPILTKKIIERMSDIESGMIVVDAALLFDWPDVCKLVDYAILVTARRDRMLARAKRKGISERLFEKIVSRQKSEKEMAAQASHVIRNDGTIDELRKKCQEIYQRIRDDCRM